MKKKILLAVGVIVILISVGVYLSMTDNQSNLESLIKQGNQIAMYIENNDGKYQANSTNEFPTEGYVLNTKKSTCKNGSVVSQNKSTKKIKIKVVNNDECSLYFDIDIPASDRTLKVLGVTVNDGNPDFSKTAPEITSFTDAFGEMITGSVLNPKQQESHFTYADSYTFNSKTGTYTLVNPQVCKYSECYSDLRDKYIVPGIGYTSTTPVNYTNLTSIEKVLSTSTLTLLKTIKSRPIQNYDSSRDGIYSMEDDYGVSYYYRGALTNNYVKFGKWSDDHSIYRGYFSADDTSDYLDYETLSQCQSAENYNFNCTKIKSDYAGKDMWWRIIRINGDGSLRIIYDGTAAYENGDESSERTIGYTPWNDNANDAKYVGYMFGGENGEASTSKEQAQTNTTDSTIKTYLDTWYQENILATGNAKYVSDTLFCNDRSTVSTPSVGDTELGFAQNNTTFGYWNRFTADDRQITSVNVTLKCQNKNDAFTVKDTTIGNGNLIYPIGLITADEVSIAGGKIGGVYYNETVAINNKYYLYKGSWYWTFSPVDFYDDYASMSIVSGYNNAGYLDINPGNLEMEVAPVINLSSEFIENMTGDGSMTNPYRLS